MPGQDPGKHPVVESVKEWAQSTDDHGHNFGDQYATVVNKMLQDRPSDPADAFMSYVAAHDPNSVVTLKDISATRSEERSKRLEAELEAYREREEAWKAQEAKRKAREAAEAAGEEYVSETEQAEGEDGAEAEAEAAPEEEGEPVAPPPPPAFARGLSDLEAGELARAKAVLKLIEKPEPALDEEGNPIEEEEGEGDAGPTNEEFQIPDVMDDANLFQTVGTGFTMEESYKLTLALKYLAERNPLNYVRLFGKILGTQNDYYVAESEFKEGEGRPEGDGEEAAEEDGEPNPATWKPKAEPMGEGINKLTYWVCSYPGGPWTRLPDVTPDMIHVARNIRRYFTGDLEAKVYSFPALEWTEKHLLRAQIARIAASTYIVPAKYFITEEEEEGEFTEKEGEVAEEPGPFGLKKVAKAPADWAPADVTNPNGWVHYHPIILSKQCVCQYQKPPKEKAEGEEEEEEEDPDAPIPVPDEEGHRKILAGISGDGNIVDGMPIQPKRKVPAWTVKKHFNNVVSVSSNHWPGALAVARGPSRYANLYIGWGLKYQRGDFTMAMPPDLQVEYVHDGGVDLAEEVDPTNAEELAKIEEEKRAAEAAAAEEE